MQEGDKRIQICRRRKCEICGELATHQLTFLLPKARINPASSGYRKDDLTYCSDRKLFVCDEHQNERYQFAKNWGIEWCADFPYNDRFKHLFLCWEKKEEEANVPS